MSVKVMPRYYQDGEESAENNNTINEQEKNASPVNTSTEKTISSLDAAISKETSFWNSCYEYRYIIAATIIITLMACFAIYYFWRKRNIPLNTTLNNTPLIIPHNINPVGIGNPPIGNPISNFTNKNDAEQSMANSQPENHNEYHNEYRNESLQNIPQQSIPSQNSQQRNSQPQNTRNSYCEISINLEAMVMV